MGGTSVKLGVAVLKASASTSTKFSVAVLKESVLNWWGVYLPVHLPSFV